MFFRVSEGGPQGNNVLRGDLWKEWHVRDSGVCRVRGALYEVPMFQDVRHAEGRAFIPMTITRCIYLGTIGAAADDALSVARTPKGSGGIHTTGDASHIYALHTMIHTANAYTSYIYTQNAPSI